MTSAFLPLEKAVKYYMGLSRHFCPIKLPSSGNLEYPPNFSVTFTEKCSKKIVPWSCHIKSIKKVSFSGSEIYVEIQAFDSLSESQKISNFPSFTISYPESSGFLVSGATPGRLWVHRKNSIFLIGCSVTVSIVLPQKSCDNKIRCPQSLPGVAPLTKKPEDSGYEIVSFNILLCRNYFMPWHFS